MAEMIDICIQHRWEGEMCSYQGKSPHQARAFRRGFDLVTSAKMSPSRRNPTMQYVFSHKNIFLKRQNQIKQFSVILMSARWAYLNISLVVKANSLSERISICLKEIIILTSVVQPISMLSQWCNVTVRLKRFINTECHSECYVMVGSQWCHSEYHSDVTAWWWGHKDVKVITWGHHIDHIMSLWCPRDIPVTSHITVKQTILKSW